MIFHRYDNDTLLESKDPAAAMTKIFAEYEHVVPLRASGLEFHAHVSLMTSSRFVDSFLGNATDEEQLIPAADVSISGVMASLYFNAVIFVALMASYELLRRAIPSVYSAKKRHQRQAEIDGLPLLESAVPLEWVGPVFGVPWAKVRQSGGLDAYMFLRYIRMCLRITLVSAFWAAVILWPVYAHGGGDASGFYYFSMANINQKTWRIWVPTFFIYFFSAFVFFVMKQEYKHYIELRMDFLGSGDTDVHPQHHYSLMVERIPNELRSDNALFEYFDNLFPGKVHSACVVLNLPKLEALSVRRLRVTRRLEKSIASFEATGVRPTHVVGRPRLLCLGIETAPLDSPCSKCGTLHDISNSDTPEKGERVDSITYYTRDLADANREMFILQKRKSHIAETGNSSYRASNWIRRVVQNVSAAANSMVDESDVDNGLDSPPDVSSPRTSFKKNSLRMGSSARADSDGGGYGSFGGEDNLDMSPRDDRSPSLSAHEKEGGDVASTPRMGRRKADLSTSAREAERGTRLIDEDHLVTRVDSSEKEFITPGGRAKPRSCLRSIIGRLGLDFLTAGLAFVSEHMSAVVDNVVGATMSSTGFVTFLDLSSVTCAASAPLTHKPKSLDTVVAPEPRDILWRNCHLDLGLNKGREFAANFLLGLGAILWSIPLTLIQALATAESLAKIPGMEWILTFDGGSLKSFINGYLPVIALLGLILILPILFEWIAIAYERRKTLSDIQASIVGRYFYYQLANIYITVTAGSIWNSLADILDHPSSILEILGQSLPTVVGYFISLLITKILAGLPMVMLRMGALSRMTFLRICFSRRRMTQRELDEVYRKDTLMYGWEYPTQLLVIIICFTYACISPIILPVGALYFFGALILYKKQVLYVYTPTYESGGSLFPRVCDRTLFGLILSQLTFIGYTLIRQGFYQPIMLLPLPIFSIWVMGYFRHHYAEPSSRLSLERAMELDRITDFHASTSGSTAIVHGEGRKDLMVSFKEESYRQPVLAEKAALPMPYRRGESDQLTEEAIRTLQSDTNESRYQIMMERGMRVPSPIEEVSAEASLSFEDLKTGRDPPSKLV